MCGAGHERNVGRNTNMGLPANKNVKILNMFTEIRGVEAALLADFRILAKVPTNFAFFVGRFSESRWFANNRPRLDRTRLAKNGCRPDFVGSYK